MVDDVDEAGAQLQALLAAEAARISDREALYIKLRDAGLIAKVTVLRFLCRQRSCVIGTVFTLGDTVYCHVRDYKFSPGMNAAESSESGRRNNTLDGDHHWPAHVYDVNELAAFDSTAGFHINCRHAHKMVNARELLQLVEGVQPGHPIKPVRV